MYTTVRGTREAVDAARRLVRRASAGGGDVASALPLLVQAVEAEAGVAEPAVAAAALVQSCGDVARAVSLVRAWAACLPRLGGWRVALADLHLDRRVTPAFREPPGGQYLGASLDYEQRLLDLTGAGQRTAGDTGEGDAGGTGGDPRSGANGSGPLRAGRAASPLEREGILVRGPSASAVDRTRVPCPPGSGRGPLLQLLGRADTGALTALAYTAVRGDGGGADPTLVELRSGDAVVGLRCPHTGALVHVGRVTVTAAEVALYGVAGGDEGRVDSRLTLGVGATLGRVERRAVSAAVLDARCARRTMHPTEGGTPADDEEFLVTALDGQEAAGFVEHLKLPHHVTFTSDLDRVRTTAAEADP